MTDEHEEWRAIDGWPYEVSNLGRVRRGPGDKIGPGRLVRPVREYVRVGLRRPGKKGIYPVHLLVAGAFLCPRPDGHNANHKDGDKANNRADNLEWLTRNENQRHAYSLGLVRRGAGHGRAKLTDEQVREIRRGYQGRWGEQTTLARRYGVSQSLVAKVLAAEVWTHLDPDYQPKACTEARMASGPSHGFAKLSARRVRAIRRSFERGVPVRELAERFGVSQHIARDVAYGRTWKKVK